MKNPFKIFKYPANVLATPCVAVDIIDSFELNKIKFRLRQANTLHSGYAVAANQIGLSTRLFYYAVGKRKGLVVNPVITQTSVETETTEEGCLSIPGKFWPVKRHAWVQLSYVDETGQMYDEKWEGLMARVAQHEIDHLNGVCIPDHI